MSRLDEFTLNVLCNPEVIDMNQDALGQCAPRKPTRDQYVHASVTWQRQE